MEGPRRGFLGEMEEIGAERRKMKGMVQFFVAFGEGVGYNYKKSKVEAEI
jgi:hypothetical protein